ncbi:udp-n-acetylglucosamine--dolichyl-phosphate n-acetylglucosaminephosphotransferase [Anaeramoeba flamelloides]|uniref:UDP-N-acetylglucosamine--dolichyl-phosphate N-acetylglucosaminephosphotransferase n=1 Tax=Anaeramoeba flamelloides TaxID=1746091 RepID=A0AAV8ADY2_9EUKA|nr:udp-n-acetylglucosamine--dolichyl-phosphate n-acetylglucosaminephosphotransferase [Anaeramoeba flamelloides]
MFPIKNGVKPFFCVQHFSLNSKLPNNVIHFKISFTLLVIFKKNNATAVQGGHPRKGSPQARADPIPESIGIVSGSMYLGCVILLQIVYQIKLSEFNAGITSICFMVLLGFMDDVLNVRWRVKIYLSFVSILPLIVAYSGSTYVLIPKFVKIAFSTAHTAIDIGIFYKIFVTLFSVFCTNSINILAGVNGLEVGQSIVIGVAVLVLNLFRLNPNDASMDQEYARFSILLILPFLAVSFAVLKFNWCPAKVFVGDTYTYFSGMVLAVVAVIGHFPEMLALFFIPQILNFLFSLPQLLGFFPMSRHRLPKLNEKTGKLVGQKQYHNLINFWLRIVGPKTEKMLCIHILIFQAVCCVAAFGIRFAYREFL